MAQFLLIGDLHLADKPPANCTESYLDDLFDIAYAALDVAKTNRCAAIIQAGDFFDHKTASRTSHATVQRAIDLVASSSCPFYIVTGNHDITNDRLSSVYETQPLGVLYKAGAIDLKGWAEDFPIYGVPWQQRWDRQSVADAFESWATTDKSKAKSLVVTHAPLFPPGAEPPFEYFSTKEWADIQGNTGSVYYGHIHESHGVYNVDGVHFCNHGSITRRSIADYNLSREVSATLWDSKTGEFERVPLPHKPSSEVFRLADVKELKEAENRFQEYLKSISETSLEITSIHSVINYIRENLNLTPELFKVITDLLEEADSGVPPAK